MLNVLLFEVTIVFEVDVNSVSRSDDGFED